MIWIFLCTTTRRKRHRGSSNTVQYPLAAMRVDGVVRGVRGGIENADVDAEP